MEDVGNNSLFYTKIVEGVGLITAEEEIAALMKMVGSLKEEVIELRKGRASDRLEFDRKIMELRDAVQFLGAHRKPVERSSELFDDERNLRAFWSITPKQHAICQLIFLKCTNTQIAERLGVTEGAVKSYVRHLSSALLFKSREELRLVYQPIFDDVSPDEYTKKTTLIKTWAEDYGSLSLEEAKDKDPYYQVICVRRYRKPSINLGNEYVPFKVKATS